jgi:hypothetical protein
VTFGLMYGYSRVVSNQDQRVIVARVRYILLNIPVIIICISPKIRQQWNAF